MENCDNLGEDAVLCPIPVPDLPTFYEINAEDLPPFGKKKTWKIFCSENIAIFLTAGDIQ